MNIFARLFFRVLYEDRSWRRIQSIGITANASVYIVVRDICNAHTLRLKPCIIEVLARYDVVSDHVN